MEPSLGILKRMTCFSPARARRRASSGIQVAAGAIVARVLLVLHLLLADLVQPFRGAETRKGMPQIDQFPGIFVVDGAPLGLAIRAVRTADIRTFVIIHAQPVQAVDQFLSQRSGL